MRLIDELKRKYAEAVADGLRPAAVKIDNDAQMELFIEVSENPLDVPGSSGLSLFMGIPILDGEEGEITIFTVEPSQVLVPLKRRRPTSVKCWDVFDLEMCEWHNLYFSNESEAIAYVKHNEL